MVGKIAASEHECEDDVCEDECEDDVCEDECEDGVFLWVCSRFVKCEKVATDNYSHIPPRSHPRTRPPLSRCPSLLPLITSLKLNPLILSLTPPGASFMVTGTDSVLTNSDVIYNRASWEWWTGGRSFAFRQMVTLAR